MKLVYHGSKEAPDEILGDKKVQNTLPQPLFKY